MTPEALKRAKAIETDLKKLRKVAAAYEQGCDDDEIYNTHGLIISLSDGGCPKTLKASSQIMIEIGNELYNTINNTIHNLEQELGAL